MKPRTLVAGWFSFDLMGASAGDLMARDVVCGWLEELGCPYDIALAPPFDGGVRWQDVEPSRYANVVFVCGPFGNGPPLTDFLARFAGRPLVGVNLTMLEPLEVWNPFTLLLERDSSARANADLAMLAPQARVPVVGLILIDSQPEYRDKDRHQQANDALRRLLARRDVAVVPIDTRLDVNATGLRSAAAIESLIARMDVVVTTRLHGMVLSIKNSVPVVALDPVAGGAKILRQAKTLDWPLVFTLETGADDALDRAFDHCLAGEARIAAKVCCENARAKLQAVRDEFSKKFSK